MNKTLIIIGCLCLYSVTSLSQDSEFSSIQNLVDGYYNAVALSDEAERKDAFGSLFTPSGTITSVITSSTGTSRVNLTPWSEVVEESARFYSQFSLSLSEDRRTADYYRDQAAVHALVTQSSVNLNTKKTYIQKLWIEFDLVYFDDRWWIQSVSWIDQDDRTPIRNAIITDTLWHQSD